MLLKNKVIFLVEDNPTNLAVIRMLLKKEGASVPFDQWGGLTKQKILSTLENYAQGIDMVLLDLRLPGGISGYDVLQSLKASPKLTNIPIIAFTAADPDTEMPKAQAAGFDGYISKPVDNHQFAKDLSAIINGQTVWRRYS